MTLLCDIKIDWSPDVSDPCAGEAILHAHLDDGTTAMLCAHCYLAVVVDKLPLIVRRGGADLRTLEVVVAHDVDVPCGGEVAS